VPYLLILACRFTHLFMHGAMAAMADTAAIDPMSETQPIGSSQTRAGEAAVDGDDGSC
jgi:hypothetical protein